MRRGTAAFKGGIIEYSAPYGQRAQTIFGAMRGNPSYVATAFDLVLGGQAVWPGRNQDIQNNCNNNDTFALAPYMMNTVDQYAKRRKRCSARPMRRARRSTPPLARPRGCRTA